MSESGFGDFEFERKFFVRELPAVAASDPTPALIVQAYLFASDGYAVRVRVQGSAPAELDATPAELVEALGEESLGTMTAKGPAVGDQLRVVAVLATMTRNCYEVRQADMRDCAGRRCRRGGRGRLCGCGWVAARVGSGTTTIGSPDSAMARTAG